MASLTFLVGALYLFTFAKGRKQSIHMSFALLCFAVGMYDVFSIGLYDSTSLAAGLVWQNLQLRTIDFISILLIWFVAVYAQHPRGRLVSISIAWFGLVFILSLVLDPSLTLSPLRPAVKYISIPGFVTVTYYEGQLGIAYEVGIASAIGFYAYLLVIVIRAYLRTRVRGLLVVVFGLCAYFAGVVNDTLVASRVYDFIYLSEYAFMIIVFSMFLVLINDMASLYHTIAVANATLEAKVEERTAEIRKLNEDLRRQAELDPLTGIYNRRFFGEYLEIELRRARNRQEHRLAQLPGINDMNFGLAMIDIDHFKLVNDTWGHPAGDKALVEVVQVIRGVIFSRDVFCRFGGEEFVILFTRTSRDGIVQAIEKIRKNVQDHVIIVTDDGRETSVTLSIGVVIFEEVPGLTTQQLLRVADARLLSAKNAGRNVAIYE
jgi:diguanylate cyclase (GGDEF)-like protein